MIHCPSVGGSRVRREALRTLFCGLAAVSILSVWPAAALAIGPAATPSPALPTPVAPAAGPAQATRAAARIPLAFVPNRGQLGAPVRFAARGSGYGLYFERDGATFVLRDASPGAAGPHRLRLRFLGARPMEPSPGAPMAARVSYLLGDDPSRWQQDLPTFSEVVYERLWPGVDLVFRGAAGSLKYEFLVHPGARVEHIHLAYAGVQALRLTPDGGLEVDTGAGVVRDTAPVSYQVVDGERVPVGSAFRLVSGEGPHAHGYGFEVDAAEHDPRLPLVIDPGLVFASLLGGLGAESGDALAVDAEGMMYVAGFTDSPDLPAGPGPGGASPAGGTDGFVAKIDPSADAGSHLVFLSYVGGAGDDRALGVAVDGAGQVYLTGETESRDFPTTPGAHDRRRNGPSDAFVVRLSATGGAVEYGTYLGGGGRDSARAIALEESGRATVAGETRSSNFPTTSGAVFASPRGGREAFVARLDSRGAKLVYSTYLGGTGDDLARAVAVDADGRAHVAGNTDSDNFPVTDGAAVPDAQGAVDAFVASLAPDASVLEYATYLGGSGDDAAAGIAVDTTGRLHVAGETGSPDLPVSDGAISATLRGATDAFLAVVDPLADPLGPGIVYASYLGGDGEDAAAGIALDLAGVAFLTGTSGAAPGEQAFPTTADADQLHPAGCTDAFVAAVDPLADGPDGLLFSTLLGGSGCDAGRAIRIDDSGEVYVTGQTASEDFPGTPEQAFLLGPTDAFAAKLSLTPVNEPPVADDLSVSTDQEVPVDIELPGSDLETAPGDLVYAIVSGPSHGTLAGDGRTVTYTPDPGFGDDENDDEFWYTVTDRGNPDGCDAAGLSCAPPATSEPGKVTVHVRPNTDSSAASVPLVLAGAGTGQPVGDVLIAERFAGALRTGARIELALLECGRFAALPRVAPVVAHGLGIDVSDEDGPRLENDDTTFSFALASQSTGKPAVLAIRGIQVITDGCVGGPVTITVDGAGSGVTTQPVTVALAVEASETPTLVDVEPAQIGLGAESFPITLTGVNLDDAATVTFDSPYVEVQSIESNETTTVLVVSVNVADDADLGPVTLTVTNPGGDSVTLPGAFSLTLPPVVTDSNRRGEAALFRGGAEQDVIITGERFALATLSPPNVAVEFEGTGIELVALAQPGDAATTSIIATVLVDENADLASRRVTVINADGGRGTSAEAIVDLTADPPPDILGAPKNGGNNTQAPPEPVITELVPAAGPRGSTLTILGAGFDELTSGNLVLFSGAGGRIVSVLPETASPDQLEVVVPAEAFDGPVVVAVNGPLSNEAGFEVTDLGLPTLVPDEVARSSETVVTDVDVYGSNFQDNVVFELRSPGSGVADPDITVQSVSLVDSGHAIITVAVDPGAALGERDVYAANPDGGTVTRSAGAQVIEPAPGGSFELALTGFASEADWLPAPGEGAVSVTLDGAGACTARTIAPEAVELVLSFTPGNPPAAPPGAITVDLASSQLPGTSTNDDCEPGPGPEPDFSLAGDGQAADVSRQSVTVAETVPGSGTYVATLHAWDNGGTVAIQVAGLNGAGESASAVFELPVDTDGDGLPDAYEADAVLNRDAAGANLLDPLNADIDSSATLDGEDRLVRDGYDTFEKYRGVHLEGPTAGRTGAMAGHQRLGAGLRTLFVRGIGFGTDLPAGYCGVDPEFEGGTDRLVEPRVPVADVLPCPGFELGTAFESAGVQVVDVSGSFLYSVSDPPELLRGFPRWSLATPDEPTADMAEVILDGANCKGFEQCDTIAKIGVRQWVFATLGSSSIGSSTEYGAPSRVFKRAVRAYFASRPYEHRTNDPARVVLDANGDPMLAPIGIVGDTNDNGLVDRKEDLGDDGKLAGDTYLIGTVAADLSAMDVNDDGCVELPLVDDPTTLSPCDPAAGTAAVPQATEQQIVRHLATHELAHAAGISRHFTILDGLMYLYSIDWIRDGNLSPEARSLLFIHNRGEQ